MLKQIQASELASNGMLFVSMARPVKKKQDLPPWAQANKCPVNEGNPTNDGTATLSEKKLSLDARLKPIYNSLKDCYPIGRCDIHDTIHCFHYQPKDLHFELSHNRLLVWANTILREEPDYARIPLALKFFQKDQSIGYKPGARGNASASVGAPVTPSQLVAHANPYMPYPPFPAPSGWSPYGYFPPSPHFAGFPHAPHGHGHLSGYASLPPPPPTAGPSTAVSDHAPSSPMLPPCELDEFCEKSSLGEKEYEGLKKLGYRVGDLNPSLRISVRRLVSLLVIGIGLFVLTRSIARRPRQHKRLQ
ncbi:hypothetical protein BV22DRAFT_1134846 [Leucogyrophana mollusca]|uniref:Uncharacterized protein n=1 Tax=Leucogyrophana mollusca TaxID=85980 RepID=A0ACB8AZ20_9AGAM|nr:hypothetical protein BV22DRAFT_1134846 [Leucogyrophana mollusca]